MIQSRAANHAKAYFSEALDKADYYVHDQELPGYWQGRLAARLGLSGATSKEDFFALCENIHPRTGNHLTPRTKTERRVGYDINFHCPKSVSILHAFAKDEHILSAFRESVGTVMQAIEQDAKTRVRKDGQYDDRKTGELVWGHFTHQTARPVEDHLPDPHLHSHCFVFNATWDAQEQRFKAGQFGDINRDMPFYQAMFHKTLADKLAGLGYKIRKTAKSFEIDGVPQQAIDLFSKRTDEIGRVAKEKGITDAKELDDLGARTRSKKQKGATMQELKEAWREQVGALEISKEEAAKPVRHAPETPRENLTARECLDHALLHCFERASVVDERRILAEAFKHGLGSPAVTVEALEKLFQEESQIIHVTEHGRTKCTTREVLREEKRMVELARQGQGKMTPLYTVAPELNLNGQQAAAVAHVLTTPHRVSIIRGAAGSGKTTLMKEAVKKIEAAGKKVITVAPTAQAARGVLRDEGFDKADTVARLLVDEKMQESLKGQVLWVDEAGLLGTKDMKEILELATKQNARVIFGGDTRQHASVIRGDALRVLNTVAGIETAEVNKIYRQKDETYRAAVRDLSQGYVKDGFEKLDKMDAIKDADAGGVTAALVDAYTKVVKQGKTALVVSPTHAQGDEVTKEIRKRLKAARIIGKKEITATRYKNLNMTEAEKADLRNLRTGQIVQFNQNVPGFQRGSRWTVNKDKDDITVLTDGKGTTATVPTHRSQDYDIMQAQEIYLSKGDKIRITRNGFDTKGKRLNNGQLLDVVRVSKSGKITLKNKQSHETYILNKDFGHIAHAHCVTSHASQGKTVDEVFIYQPAATFPATDAKQFYVSVSRAREKAHIYTDDKEELLRHAATLGERTSALELIGAGKVGKYFAAQAERQKQSHEKEKGTEPKPPSNRNKGMGPDR